MRHSILTGWFLTGALIIELSLFLAGPARAFEVMPCEGPEKVKLGDFSWITPVAGEASARVSLLLPGPGVLTVEAVAGERVDAQAWVDVTACGEVAGPRPITLEASLGRRSVRVIRGGVVSVIVGTLAPAPAVRLTLASRFEPATAPGRPGRDPDDDGDGTEESNNEVLPTAPAAPSPPGMPSAAGMGKMEEDDDGDGTEESNNEVLPTTAPPEDPAILGLEMRRMVLGRLERGPGPTHADHSLVVRAAGSLVVRVEADGPVRLDLITASGLRIASAVGEGDRRSVVMSPNLPAGRYYLRVVGEAERSLHYGIRIDRRP